MGGDLLALAAAAGLAAATAVRHGTRGSGDRSRWYETLPAAQRERLFATMRAMDGEYMRLLDATRSRSAPFGTMAVGAGAFDTAVHGEAILSFLSGLRKGLDPDQAAASSREHLKKVVERHNQKRPNDSAWQRWVGHGSSYLPGLVDRVRRAVAQAPPGVPQSAPLKPLTPAAKRTLAMMRSGWELVTRTTGRRSFNAWLFKDHLERRTSESVVDQLEAHGLIEGHWIRGDWHLVEAQGQSETPAAQASAEGHAQGQIDLDRLIAQVRGGRNAVSNLALLTDDEVRLVQAYFSESDPQVLANIRHRLSRAQIDPQAFSARDVRDEAAERARY